MDLGQHPTAAPPALWASRQAGLLLLPALNHLAQWHSLWDEGPGSATPGASCNRCHKLCMQTTPKRPLRGMKRHRKRKSLWSQVLINSPRWVLQDRGRKRFWHKIHQDFATPSAKPHLCAQLALVLQTSNSLPLRALVAWWEPAPSALTWSPRPLSLPTWQPPTAPHCPGTLPQVKSTVPVVSAWLTHAQLTVLPLEAFLSFPGPAHCNSDAWTSTSPPEWNLLSQKSSLALGMEELRLRTLRHTTRQGMVPRQQ